MLLRWKEKRGAGATYKVLYEALCHEYVDRKDLAQADHPLLVGAVVDWNLSDDLLLFIEEIHKNNTVAIICSKMQNSKQIFQ